MTESDTDRRLKSIESKLDGVVKLMEKVAVQKERLDNVEKRVDGLWSKWDKNIDPHIQNCPKEQVRWLWFIVLPMGFTQLAVAFGLLRMAFK